MANRLEFEKSPYLLQHKENPVDWYPWCSEAFRRAEEEDKPVFLSIGYSTCHWCHVMAHESFEDRETAEILNRDFICIKVDREERPDIDAVYMSVCQAMTGSGGWPLTVIMTPDQKPFFAGTYFPKKSQYGRPGLTELLTQIKKLWDNDRARLLKTGDRILEAISADDSSGYDTPDKSLMRTAFSQFSRNFDSRWGGFGSAPKFPAAHNLLFLMDYAARENEPEALKMAIKTLHAMAAGGIYDHIGGGFSRYSTDQKWLVPHFEKMLYDNALLMIAYTRGFQLTGDERLAQAARSTGEYVLRELTDDEGGFYCGQDADSDGVEGKYYVFTESEIMTVLDVSEGREFCRIYDITDKGNFEGKNIPNLLTSGAKGWNTDSPALKKLYEYRRQRTSLHTDDKILLSWNSWMIIAMVQTGRVLGEEKFLNAAVRAQRWIEEKMTDETGRLYLRYRDGEAAHAGQLEDYAVYTLALLELYSLTFEVKYLSNAIYRAQQMTELFEDEENGGFFMNASDSEQLIARPKETYDGAMPSGNSAAAMVLQKLADLTGEVKWREAADRQHSFMAGKISGYPAGHSFGLMAMADVLYPHRELICAGKSVTEDLIEYIKSGKNSGVSILFKSADNGSKLAECAPFTSAYAVPEEGTMWYLCENGACHVPVSDFSELNL